MLCQWIFIFLFTFWDRLVLVHLQNVRKMCMVTLFGWFSSSSEKLQVTFYLFDSVNQFCYVSFSKILVLHMQHLQDICLTCITEKEHWGVTSWWCYHSTRLLNNFATTQPQPILAVILCRSGLDIIKSAISFLMLW